MSGSANPGESRPAERGDPAAAGEGEPGAATPTPAHTDTPIARKRTRPAGLWLHFTPSSHPAHNQRGYRQPTLTHPAEVIYATDIETPSESYMQTLTQPANVICSPHTETLNIERVD